MLIHPVSCHSVLDQVVSTDREEVYFLGKLIRQHSCCWDFNHDTHLDIVCYCNAFSLQLSFFFVINRFSFAEFCQKGYHWEHDTQLSMYRSTQESADLCTEHSIASFRDRDTQSTETKEWVHFMRHIEVRKLLISTNVHCTNNYWFSIHSFKHSLVCFILLIFCWEVLRIHVKELSPVKTNCFCTVSIDTFNVFRRTDIGSQFEVLAICSHSLSILKQFPFSFLLSISLTSCFKCCDLFFSWVDNHFTSDTVSCDHIAVFYKFSNVISSQYCCDFKRTCHDSRVACPAADIGYKSFDEFLIQLCCIRRSQVMSNDN